MLINDVKRFVSTLSGLASAIEASPAFLGGSKIADLHAALETAHSILDDASVRICGLLDPFLPGDPAGTGTGCETNPDTGMAALTFNFGPQGFSDFLFLSDPLLDDSNSRLALRGIISFAERMLAMSDPGWGDTENLSQDAPSASNSGLMRTS